MKAMLRVSPFFFVSLLMTACASAAPPDADVQSFNGAWSSRQCDKHNPQLECGTFVLYLAQEGDRLCGEHFVATPGAARLDEGGPGTVLGTVSKSAGVLVIKSGRNDAQYLARLEQHGDVLMWKRIGMVAPGSDDEPPVIPGELRLQKDVSFGVVKHLEEFRTNGCAWPDWINSK